MIILKITLMKILKKMFIENYIYMIVHESRMSTLLMLLKLCRRQCSNLHFLLSVVADAGGEAEVGDFELHPLVEEHIAEFEVPVDDVPAVDVFDPLHQLLKVVPHFRLRQRLPLLQHVD